MLEIQYFLCLERGMLPMICLLIVTGNANILELKLIKLRYIKQKKT